MTSTGCVFQADLDIEAWQRLRIPEPDWAPDQQTPAGDSEMRPQASIAPAVTVTVQATEAGPRNVAIRS